MGDTFVVGPITINLTFLGIAAGAVAAIGLVVQLFRARRKREDEVAQEYSRLAGNREVLWSAIRGAYAKFRASRPHAPSQVETLLAVVGLPPDVGNRGGRDLKLWPAENAATLNSDQRLLWEFVTLVYPPRDNRAGKVTDHSIIDQAFALDFHEARRVLAHFWDRAGRAVTPSYFGKHYRAALPDLVLLSWFDIALKQWTGDPDEGKIGLFRVGLEVSQTRK